MYNSKGFFKNKILSVYHSQNEKTSLENPKVNLSICVFASSRTHDSGNRGKIIDL